MEEHQPIDIDYQPIWDDDYIEYLMTQHYIEFDEDLWCELRFWDHIFPLAEFTKDGIFHVSINWNSRTSSFEEVGIDVGEQDNKRHDLR